ncbi:hypothetical protein Tco_1330191 [Tanacetum coccineum]
MIKTELDNVKEYQILSKPKIHPSEAADTKRVNRKVGEETDYLGDGKVSWLGPVSTSKANLAPKQLSLDNCSVKTVFLFNEGDAPTSYSTSCGVGKKDDGKRKSDDIRTAIKDQENEVLKRLVAWKVGRNKNKGWKLWRSPSTGCGLSVSSSKKGAKNGNRGRLSTSGTGDVEVSFVAAVARAQPKDFMAIKKEWAAIPEADSAGKLCTKRRSVVVFTSPTTHQTYEWISSAIRVLAFQALTLIIDDVVELRRKNWRKKLHWRRIY